MNLEEQYSQRYESLRLRVKRYCSSDNINRDWSTQNTLLLTTIAMRINLLGSNLQEKYFSDLGDLEDELRYYSPSKSRSVA